MHEAKQHRHNTWITLTYSDENLPERYWTGKKDTNGRKIFGGTLQKSDMQRFIRSLRKRLSRKGAIEDFRILFAYKDGADMGRRPIPQLRYYYGGEYGERLRRPHYHACLFGIDFADKKHYDTTSAGYKLYTSKTLEELWPYGRHMIGDLTWETAAYTARYIMKKITGQIAQAHYTVTDPDTGEIKLLLPEYNDMSRRPGIGNAWFMQNYKDVYRDLNPYVRVRGRKTAPPRYYEKLYTEINPSHIDYIKDNRKKEIIKNQKKFTTERLMAEEKITRTKIKSLQQRIEG